ncbi:MAG: glycosyltransferase family 2 protein [Candidatus Cloacimonetes bacterium]|nr:glycosyltransferase family 2 protein [Candidatus Cloacimonadota bacterium]
MKLSIVVPCYNEEQNIPLIFDRFCQIIQRDDIEVIFVNNGSTDQSQAILEKLCCKYSFSKVHHVQKNIGYGHGIKSGLQIASGDYLAYTHADMQTDPKDLLLALKIIEDHENPNNIFVKGERKGRPLFDQFFTIGMSLFETCYLKTLLWDINAQPNLFHRSFYENLHDIPDDFSLDLFLLYNAFLTKQKLIRFEVVFPKRIHGTSKWNTSFSAKWRFIKRTIQFSREMKSNI